MGRSTIKRSKIKLTKLKFGCIAIASFFLIATLQPNVSVDSLANSPHPTQIQLDWTAPAQARSSGGRSGGGSFRSSGSRSSSSSSKSSSSSSSKSNSSNTNRSTNSNNRNSQPSYSQPNRSGGTVIVPIPLNNQSGYNSNRPYRRDDSGAAIVGLIFLLIILIILVAIGYFVFKAVRGLLNPGDRKAVVRNRELDNDTVTVSKIQVALFAQARDIQTDLTNLSLEIDTDTPEGLYQLMQESALALLRSPENWSHVLSSTQTVKSLDEAESLFSQLSIAERSKFSAETLTNVGGRTSRRQLKVDPEEGFASYIVVTLLIGTAHDRAFFEPIRTKEALEAVLQKIAGMPAEYLLVFELLWSPQDPSDSLTSDELLTEYTDMLQLV